MTKEELFDSFHLQRNITKSLPRSQYYFGDATGDTFAPKLDFKVTNTNTNEQRHYYFESRYQRPLQDGKSRGLVVLLHSYSSNTHALLYDSTAFLQQGYDTLIIELFGHDSLDDQPVSFGRKDTELLRSVLKDVTKDINRSLPLILYGKSYGASIAAQYIQRYGGVDGLIAVAPLADFTQTAVYLIKKDYGWFSHLMGESWLSTTIEKTLHEQNTTSEKISTANILSQLPDGKFPKTLLLGGAEDKISPVSEFEALTHHPQVRQHILPKRHHIEMMIFDDNMNKVIQQWLLEFEAIKNPA